MDGVYDFDEKTKRFSKNSNSVIYNLIKPVYCSYMHYKDGTEAKVGDIVKGIGYNLPYQITGPVTKLISGQEFCNIRIEVRVSKFHSSWQNGDVFVPEKWDFTTYEEAGATKEFELVYRKN